MANHHYRSHRSLYRRHPRLTVCCESCGWCGRCDDELDRELATMPDPEETDEELDARDQYWTAVWAAAEK